MPDVPGIPELVRGKLMAHVRIAYLGHPADGADLVAPLRAVAKATEDSVTEMPYTEVARIHQDATQPVGYHERNIMLRELDRAAAAALIDEAGPDSGCAEVMVELRHLGGALARDPVVPNAVGNRDARFCLATLSPPDRPGDALLRRMAAWGTGRRYLNFLGGPLTATSVRDAFEPDAYRVLAAMKSTYDSRNLFRVNHNIPPTS